MKKILLLLLLFSAAALRGMNNNYSYKKNSCNLGYFGIPLKSFDCTNDYNRWEVFSEKKCIGSVKYNKSECTLLALWIQEEHRGKRLGKALFFKAMRDMKEYGCKSVSWYSEQDAIPFYKKYNAFLLNPDCEKSKKDFCTMYINFIQEK